MIAKFSAIAIVGYCLSSSVFAADVPEFEHPSKGLKSRVAEHYATDENNPLLSVLTNTVTEVFNEVGDLVSRTEEEPNGKTIKRIYKHNYNDKGETLDRQELDGSGNILREWKYDRPGDGSLKVTVTISVRLNPKKHLYVFDKRGALLSVTAVEVDKKEKNPPSVKNIYGPDGQLTEQIQMAGAKVKRQVKFEYSNNGKLQRRAEYQGSNGNIAVEETYNAVGDISVIEFYDHYGMEVLERVDHEYKYDDSDRMLEDAWGRQKIVGRKFKSESGVVYYKYELQDKK